MTREEQLALARRDAVPAMNRLIAMFSTHPQEIIATAIADLDSNHERYGDTGFRKSPKDLDCDTIEDLGAALARQIMRRNRI